MKQSFTLIETVVTLALIAALSSSVFSTYLGALRLSRRLAETNYEQRALDRVVDKIRTDLSSLVYIKKISKEFKGLPKRISFGAFEKRYDFKHSRNALDKIYLNYYTYDDQLKRKRRLITNVFGEKRKELDEIILGKKTELSFRYAYWNQHKRTYDWKKRTLPVSKREDLPELIEVELKMSFNDKVLSKKSIVSLKKDPA